MNSPNAAFQCSCHPPSTDYWCVALGMYVTYFNQDAKKTFDWMHTENPLLGNISPVDMIMNGKGKKLFDFVVHSIVENYYG